MTRTQPAPWLGRALLSLSLSLLVTQSACNRAAEPVDETTTPAKITVRVTRVRRGSIADERRVIGRTAALSTVRIASPVAGRLTALTALPGDRFDSGAVVARVLPLQNQAGLDGLDILEQNERPAAGEKALNDRIQRRLRQNDVAIRTPLRAVVSARLRNPGEQVAAGDVLLELFDPESTYVLAQIPVSWAGEIHTGTAARIRTAAGDFAGRVASIVPLVEARSLTVPARIELTAALPLLDAPVECSLMLTRHDAALLLPIGALLTSHTSDRGSVMLAEGGQARRREVGLGLRNADDVEVTNGLAEGDLVAVDGQYGLPDGTPIEPQPVDQ